MNIHEPVAWTAMGADVLAAGHLLGEPALLFEKIEDNAIQVQVDRLEQKKRKNMTPGLQQATPPKENISIDAFTAMDIRVGTIIDAEKVAGTRALVKLTVDTGIDRRVIVSGIAGQYTTGELVGRQVSVLLNLEPKTLKGIESRGMILMTAEHDGKFSFVAPDKHVTPGTTIR